MSMIFNFLPVSSEQLKIYLNDSSLLEAAIYEEDDEREPLDITDIDKSWNGILYLLTGKSIEDNDHPLAAVFFSGQLIDEEQDLGYGPGHYLTAGQVQEISKLLEGITAESLKVMYDPEKMNALEVYPQIWNEEVALEYLLEYYDEVKDLFARASKEGMAVIGFVS